MADKTVQRLTAADLLDRLGVKYAAPAFAFLPAIRSNTGFTGAERYADAVAMSLWPSRGLELHGFEVKVHRGDWLRELKQPEKAEVIWAYCHRWWVVAERDVVGQGEMPPTWGLLVPYASGLRAIVEAPLLSPTAPDFLFLAAILRRAQEVVTPAARLKEEYDAGRKHERKKKDERETYWKDELARKENAIREFELASGVRISEWGAGDIGKAVRVVLEGRNIATLDQLRRMKATAENVAKELGELIGSDGQPVKGEM